MIKEIREGIDNAYFKLCELTEELDRYLKNPEFYNGIEPEN